ncbi:MAG TPA: PHP domain-containing protein [Candidatus Limiplasma sp.]|nr:PHP domain-containing protein [Candidatus Limiplasma sp.]HPS80420.1 PHP domain-containing protein [Candidatus Limiplasma sp.]
MIRADLHIHSTVSDGGDTVAEIVEKAVKRGLTAIAITDHDTLAQRRLLPNDPRIQVLCGIEISAIDPATGVKAHVLGYCIRDDALVEAFVKPLRERRH